MISATDFTTNDVNCPIEEISFAETTDISTGYDLSKPAPYYPTQCTDHTDLTNQGCRKVYIPTDGKVRNTSNLKYYKFLFTAKAKGGGSGTFLVQYGVDCHSTITLVPSDNSA